MIRGFALALCLTASAALAEETPPPMSAQDCLSGWQGFTYMTNMPPRLSAIQPDVTPQGWCRIDRSNGDLRDNDFASVDWRGADVALAVERKGFPTDFEAHFRGISLVEGLKLKLGPGHERAVGELRIKAQRDPDNTEFLIERFIFDFGNLGEIAVAASGDGIDLDSIERMQLSLGGLRIKSLELDLRTTDDLSRALTPVIEDAAPLRDWPLILGRMPNQMFTPGSREALMQFARALPAARGRLTLSIHSDTGLGLLQLVGAMMSFDKSDGRVWDMAAAIAQLLNGSRIDASWTR